MAKKITQWKQYTIPLGAARKAARKKRAGKARTVLKKYFAKHARKKPEEVKISLEVNHALGKKSWKAPKRIQVQAKETSDGKLLVYLRGSKRAAAEEKAMEKKEAEKKKEEEKTKKEEQKEKPKQTTGETPKKEQTTKKATEEKKQKEPAAKKEQKPAEQKPKEDEKPAEQKGGAEKQAEKVEKNESA